MAEGSSPFSADTERQAHVLDIDANPLPMQRAQVGVFKDTDKVGLGSFLQRHNGCALKAQLNAKPFSDLAHDALKRQLAYQQLGGLLVAPNLAQRDGSWAKPVLLLRRAVGGTDLQRSMLRSAGIQLAHAVAIPQDLPWIWRCHAGPSRQYAFGAPYHRWTCGQFASCEPVPCPHRRLSCSAR